MPTMPTAPLNARIDQSIKDDLLAVCERTQRSQSYHTEKALAEYVAREKEFRALIQEGLDAADRGECVEHDRVMEWLESWGTDDELPLPKPTPA